MCRFSRAHDLTEQWAALPIMSRIRERRACIRVGEATRVCVYVDIQWLSGCGKGREEGEAHDFRDATAASGRMVRAFGMGEVAELG